MNPYTRYLAYQIKRLAEHDKPIPLDLFMAAETAGMDPEEIYDCHQDELMNDAEPDEYDEDVWHVVTNENLDETNDTLWNRIIGE